MPGSAHPSSSSSEASTCAPGLAAFDAETHARLGQRGWRGRTAMHSHRRHGLAWSIVVLLHVAFFAILWHELKPRHDAPPVAQDEQNVLQVRLLSRASDKSASHGQPAVAPVAPVPAPATGAVAAGPLPPVRSNTQRSSAHLPAAKPPFQPIARPQPAPRPGEMTVSLHGHHAQPHPARAATANASTAVQLFDASGQPILAPKHSTVPSSDYVEHDRQGDRAILQHQDPTHYHATRFDENWHRRGGGADDALQKIHDKTTLHHTVHLPQGIRLNCSISLLPPGGGCGGGAPPPPSKKDGDERLNMAPAASLAKDPHAPPPPSLAACVAAYRADKPLPYGCPVDTPAHAVDAEAKDRAAERHRRTQWGH